MALFGDIAREYRENVSTYLKHELVMEVILRFGTIAQEQGQLETLEYTKRQLGSL